MKIVLVMLNNYQKYIIDNIENLIYFDNKDITVITNKEFENKFVGLNIELVFAENIISNYSNITKKIKNTFRNGFWYLTSYRFNVLEKYMKIYNVKNIIHIENDILLYKNVDSINFHNKNKILITMDSFKRCIPGFLFIPSHKELEICLNVFNSNFNDMQNFALSYHKTNVVDTLPIFIDNTRYTEKFNDICKNFNQYGYIFDAAAIGQYLGGIDPIIKKTNTVGFVNETCIVDYSNFKFIYQIINGKKKPFIVINDKKIEIINLHIHSKNLKKFIFK